MLTTGRNTTSVSMFDDGETTPEQGFWAIRFYDHWGEDWLTVGISANAQV